MFADEETFAVSGSRAPERNAFDSRAKPTDGGDARKTLKTFFKNASPITTCGEPLDVLLISIEKNGARQLPEGVVPRFRSSELLSKASIGFQEVDKQDHDIDPHLKG